jgi:glycyl-tRNA synthetase beta chain
MGDMDPSFLDLPPEVIKLSMRTHQKYFAVRDPAKKDGGLAPKFVVVANLDAADGGKKIAEGNSRVLSARLNDARFFWDNDRKVSLESRFEKLGNIVFHEKLGTVKDKAERVAEVAPYLAMEMQLAVSESVLERAACLSKCDLVSDMVGEFPELEGVMGRYYALLQGETSEVADSIRDHYRPKGPSDQIPSTALSVVSSITEKLDTLFCFWWINEMPSGSRDPYALRRAALGVIRTVLYNNIALKFRSRSMRLTALVAQRATIKGAIQKSDERIAAHIQDAARSGRLDAAIDELTTGRGKGREWDDAKKHQAHQEVTDKIESLLAFFADRLKVHLREQGARHDLIDAVFALGEDDLVLIVKRVEALGEFLATEDGKNLLAGYKRAANILAIEEKKDGTSYSGQGVAMAGDPAEVDALVSMLAKAAPDASAALEKEDFAGAMRALSKLRGPVDAYFDKVTVNADVAEVRVNRLKILSQIRDALGRVADFSKVEG